jgi:hypothetical protein
MTAVLLRTPFGPEVRHGAEASWDGLAIADIAEVMSHAVGAR